MSIGGRIRQLWLKQHRTQEETAGRCGFTKSFLSKIESGRIVPPVAVLVKIAAAPGVKESALIEGDQNVNAVYAAKDEVEANAVKAERGYWIYSFATQHRDKRMQPFLFVARKGEVKEHHLTHEAEEFMYVVEGEM